MIGQYQTVRAFRAALEDRLKQIARERGIDLMRLRRQVAFDRLLARLFAAPAPPWLLKGGYALELRLGSSARATRDIDLSIPSLDGLRAINANHTPDPNTLIRECLQDAAERDLGDGFVFRIGASMADLDAAPYGGARNPLEARLDSRAFTTFHLDAGVGDVAPAEPEWLIGQDLLNFAGIPPARVAALTSAQQFAEKIHAYTLPRDDRMNTRVKDLVDIALLIALGLPDLEGVRRAIQATFTRRETHPIPQVLAAPPPQWAAAYTALAVECGLPRAALTDGFGDVVAYWEMLFPTPSA